ncbi:ABC transporter substrate-binding protein, partial [Streptomyces sp. GC420]|uniref:ABC transporter substrate-binding protein n=1 Tax=Streptomyces sp. GC420 TaxID=2697568 RepID=UPI001D9C8E95
MAQASSRLRSLALFTAGALLPLPVLAGCSSDADESAARAVPQDIAPLDRGKVADGGTLDWAVDTMPETLNAFQADADAATARITGAVLPSLFPLDARGRPGLNPDYLESAEVVEREPRQVVLYKLSQQAVWSDGREIGAQDFAAQWRALSGKDNAYWTARNAGYERIQKVERGANDLEVKVTFARPYADWKSLFTPLYPKEVMGGPDAFNDGARAALKVTAGPYLLQELDREGGTATLVPNPRWWGDRPRLEKLVFRAVPREKRAAELAAGRLDLAEIDPATARRVVQAHGPAAGIKKGAPGAPGAPAAPGEALGLGPAAGTTAAAASALRSWAVAHGSDARKALEEKEARAAAAVRAAERNALRGYDVRKSLEPAYTQLALNGSSGPLADERVRRAVARAIDRHALAEAVLGPLGMPTAPLGSHLAMAGQAAYADSSGALGKQDVKEAQALLADAGWERSGPLDERKERDERNKAAEERNAKNPKGDKEGKGEKERPNQK